MSDVISRGYKEKNKKIRSNVAVTERGEKAGGGHLIKADINRLICTTANPKVRIHYLFSPFHMYNC